MAWLTETSRANKESGKKEKYYAIQWRDERGKTHTRALGFIQKPEASRLLKVFEGKLASGDLVEPPPSASGSPPAAARPEVPNLVAYLRDVYLPVVERDKAPKTATSAKTAANAIIKVIGEVPLDEVGFVVIDRYATERRQAGRKARTLIIELWTLRGCLQHACDSGVIGSVPKFPSVKDRDRIPHRYLTPEETRSLLGALKPPKSQPHVTRGSPPLQYDELSYLAVLGCLNTGARKNEMLSRGWEDVRWQQGPHGTLIFGAKPEIGFRMKTGRDRAVPLTPELRAALDERHQEVGCPRRGLIFARSDDPTRPRQDFRSALEGACQRAGIPFVHPHGLRHTWATRLAMAGVDRRTLMELGGWADSRMLDEIYSHAPDAHKAEVMARSGIAPPVGAEAPTPSARLSKE